MASANPHTQTMPAFLRGRRGALALSVLTLGFVIVIAFAVVDRIPQGRPISSLTIRVLSGQPGAVTGSSARIQVFTGPDIAVGDVQVMLNGTVVTDQLAANDAGLEGLVTGLREGTNSLRAIAPAAREAVVTMVKHPLSGPMLAGRQPAQFVCDLSQFQSASGQRLSAQGESDCSFGPRTDYVYRSTTQTAFRPLTGPAVTNPARRPTDLADVTLPDGSVRPFIVRVESLTIDRGVAQFAMLHDPATAGDVGWNRKLVYGFGGGGCGGGYQQGKRTYDVLAANLLSSGFAVASNSLNVSSQNCSDVLAAEAFAMTREWFVKQHGAPLYTMGTGCSGGAAQAYQIADNYPGLLNGIVVGCSLADIGFDLGQLAFDARLLSTYASRHPGSLTHSQLGSVTGLGSPRRLSAMSELARILDPANSHGAALPPDQRYSATTNPTGARGSVFDQTVNVYGVDAAGDTNRPVGNVGVQYGLAAFNKGTISADQFLDLNARIGGLSADLAPTPERTRPSDLATVQAYRSGRMLNGGGGLSAIPIIDYRATSYGSGQESLDLRVHTFAIKDRLTQANGDADNQVRLTDGGHGRFNLERPVLTEALDQMDRWLMAIAKSPFPGHYGVVQSKPSDLVDACFTRDGRKLIEEQVFAGPTRCNAIHPTTSTPRMVAGGPLSSDVISCALKPVDQADYPTGLNSAQLARLKSLYPDGVCDWGSAGRGQQPSSGPWQHY